MDVLQNFIKCILGMLFICILSIKNIIFLHCLLKGAVSPRFCTVPLENPLKVLVFIGNPLCNSCLALPKRIVLVTIVTGVPTDR